MQLISYTIYSTPNCHYCGLLKNWLTDNGISYQNKDVALDMVARQEMVEKSQQLGVPVSVLAFQEDGGITEKVVIGYDQPQLADLLSLQS